MKNMDRVALVQPFWSHDELLPHLYDLLSRTYLVDVFLPENLNQTRGNILSDLGYEVDITWFEPSKRGLQLLRNDLNDSDYSRVVLVTFSNYLRRLKKPVVRIVHNVDEELKRIPEDIDEFKLNISYLTLANFITRNLTKSLNREVSVSTFYPVDFNGLTRQTVPTEAGINITVVGRVSTTKSYESLLRFVIKYKEKLKKKRIVFHLVGAGGNYYETARHLIEEEKLDHVIRFVEPKNGDVVSNTELLDLLQNNTHFLMPLVSSSFYGVKKISATYSWAIALNIPLIHEVSNEAIYPGTGYVYRDDNYEDVFDNFSLIDQELYLNYCDSISRIKSEYITRNLNVFQLAK